LINRDWIFFLSMFLLFFFPIIIMLSLTIHLGPVRLGLKHIWVLLRPGPNGILSPVQRGPSLAQAAPKRKQIKYQVAPCRRLGVVLSKHHMALSLPAARTQFYFGSYPARPKASLGSCLWMPKPKRHLALRLQPRGSSPSTTWLLGCSPPGRNSSVICPNVVFFHNNSNFLKFINDDNNIYALINFNENTKNFIIQIIIFLVAIIWIIIKIILFITPNIIIF